jgi:capping protein beta
MTSQLDCMLDLCRRLPPQRIEENLEALVELCPDLADDLL